MQTPHRRPIKSHEHLRGCQSFFNVRWFLASLAAFGLTWPLMLHADTHTWTGTVGGNWATPGNWSGGVAPSAGDALTFPRLPSRYEVTNNMAVGTTFRSITLLGAGYRLYGNAVLLTSSLLSTNAGKTNRVYIDLGIPDSSAGITNLGGTLELYGNIGFTASATTPQALVIDSGDKYDTMLLYGQLSGSSSKQVLKYGFAPLELRGSLANTLSGRLSVRQGSVLLRKAAGVAAVAGPLTIGSSGGGTATVRLFFDGQISDNASVSIYGSGRLDLNGHSDAIGTLSMTGGRIDNVGSGVLTLTGDVTATSAASGTYTGAEIGCVVSLANVDRRFTVNDGPQGNDLVLWSEVRDGGIIKEGTGHMVLFTANTYNGETHINAGALTIEHDASLGGVANGTYVASGAVLSVWAEAAPVNSAEPLWLAGNGPSGGGALLVWKQGSFNGPVVLAAHTTINNGPTSADLLTLGGTISGPGGLTKVGLGTLRFSGSSPNTYLGDTTVMDGELQLNKLYALYYGSLTIGDGWGGPNSDVVRNLVNNGVYGIPVLIKSSGLLVNDHSTLVGPIDLDGGSISGGSTFGLGLIQPLTTYRTDPTNGPSTITGRLQVVQTTALNITNDLYVQAAVFGSGTLTKNGPATLQLAGSNTFSGYFYIEEGIVIAGSTNALGGTTRGTYVRPGTTLLLSFAGGERYYDAPSCSEPLTLAGAGYRDIGALYISQGDDILGCNGPITLGGDTKVVALRPFALQSAISGVGPLRLRVPSTQWGLFLSSAVSYTGTTYLEEGYCYLGSSPSFPGALVIGLTNGTRTAWAYSEGANPLPGDDVTIHEGSYLSLWRLMLAKESEPDGGFYGPPPGNSIRNLYIHGGELSAEGSPPVLLGNVSGSSTPKHTAIIYGDSGWMGSIIPALVLAPGNHKFDVYADDAARLGLQVIGSLSGEGGIVKEGPGDLLLGQVNSFAGSLVISNGAVVITNSAALGDEIGETWVYGPSCLVLRSNITVSSETVHLDTQGVLRPLHGMPAALLSEGGTNTWNGPIMLEQNTAFSGLSDLCIGGPIGGPGELTINGTVKYQGTTGTNSYTNVTHVAGRGELCLGRAPGNHGINGPLDVCGRVEIESSDQILDTVDVTLAQGRLALADNSTETVRVVKGFGALGLGNASSAVIITPETDEEMDVEFFGAGKFRKAGRGKLLVGRGSGVGDPFTGLIEVVEGILELDDHFIPEVRIIGPGGLAGNGVVKSLIGGSGGTPGAKLLPGKLTPPLVNTDYYYWFLECLNLTLTPNCEFSVDLNGTGEAVTVRTGPVTLTNPRLRLNLHSPVTEGNEYVLIRNDSSNSITGQFAGLPNGSIFNVSGLQFRANYAGGNGNDFSLTLTNVGVGVAGISVAGGNGNGEIESAECNFLYLTLTNKGSDPVTGISAMLHPESDDVFFSQAESKYGDLPPGGVQVNAVPFVVSTSDRFVAGSNLNFLVTLRTANHGTFSLPVSLPTGAPGAFVRYDNNDSYPIPDNGSIDIPLTVAGFTSFVARAELSLHASHSSTADLDISLIAPDGTTVDLSSDNGGAGDDYGADCVDDARTRLADSALTSISTGIAPFIGPFKPEQALAAFRGRQGTNVNGVWKLRVVDDMPGSAGSVRCVSLFLAPAVSDGGNEECHTCIEIVDSFTNAYSPAHTTWCLTSLEASKCGSSNVLAFWREWYRDHGGAIGTSQYGIDNSECVFRQYVFTNQGPARCIGVSLNDPLRHSLWPLNLMTSLAVLGTEFVPGLMDYSFLGSGNTEWPAPGTRTYSFQAPADSVFSIVVLYQAFHGFGGFPQDFPAPYMLRVSNLDCDQQLDIQPGGQANVRVSWPTSGANYRLHATTNLPAAPASFVPVPGDPVVSGGYFVVTNQVTGPERYYILKKTE